MKTIFISTPDGYHTRMLLRTRLFQLLKNSGHRIVILSPNWKEEYFRKEFINERVFVEQLVIHQLSWLERKLLYLRNEIIANHKLVSTFNIKYEHLRRTRYARAVVKKSAAFLFGHKLLRDGLVKLESVLFPDRYYQELFRKYQPRLVIPATPGFKIPDIPLLKRAKRERVKTLCLVLSWDNLTSKGQMWLKPDRLIVWNDIMKREAIELHDSDPDNIYVAGIPHFDIYCEKENFLTREEFFRHMSLDPAKRLLVLASSPPVIYAYFDEIIRIILSAIEKEEFIYPCQLLVRLHPQDPQSRYDTWRGSEYMTIDYPGRYSSKMGWDPSKDDMLHLANTMLHSDCVINVASTISIDASCFDTPIVNIGFDGFQNKPYYESAIRYYDYTHYKNIVKTGGVRIAKSPQELIRYINLYLENPKLDSEGRKRIVEQQCYKLDGRSSERAANYILSFLEGKCL